MCVGDVSQPPLRPVARSRSLLRSLEDYQYMPPAAADRDRVTYDGPQP